ncbi:MAG: hypothetical protein NWF14_00425 [Candidatus Bathyarchaeota archaeon]|nr:hypothetical protein [Candidatus Bathyarchaeota archaeon]
MLIKDFFHKARKPFSEIILETARELGKCYSRLELASSKLGKRNKELFNVCIFYLKKGSKARATVYANEIVEIRKVLSILRHTQLSVERAILRLDTLKMVTPTFESLQAAFCDVKNALGLVAGVMPSITPEMAKLNNVVSEILGDTQLNLTMPTPLTINDPTTEAILQEAASLVEQELQSRIPEPPLETKIPRPLRPSRPVVALAAGGSEVYLGEDGSPIASNGSGTFDTSSTPLLEELVMDYVERNNGDMNVPRCAEELNLPSAEVFEALEVLSRKGKIKILR